MCPSPAFVPSATSRGWPKKYSRSPARLAAARGRRVVVALDEFQAIGSFNGGSVEEALRAAVQHQRDVGYVFSGSEPTLMERMLGPKRPFYKAGPVIRLGKIPADEFDRIHRRSVRAVGFQAGARHRDAAVVDLAGTTCPTTSSDLPTRPGIQVRLGGRRRATLDDLHQALHRLLAEHHMMFEASCGSG